MRKHAELSSSLHKALALLDDKPKSAVDWAPIVDLLAVAYHSALRHRTMLVAFEVSKLKLSHPPRKQHKNHDQKAFRGSR